MNVPFIRARRFIAGPDCVAAEKITELGRTSQDCDNFLRRPTVRHQCGAMGDLDDWDEGPSSRSGSVRCIPVQSSFKPARGRGRLGSSARCSDEVATPNPGAPALPRPPLGRGCGDRTSGVGGTAISTNGNIQTSDSKEGKHVVEVSFKQFFSRLVFALADS